MNCENYTVLWILTEKCGLTFLEFFPAFAVSVSGSQMVVFLTIKYKIEDTDKTHFQMSQQLRSLKEGRHLEGYSWGQSSTAYRGLPLFYKHNYFLVLGWDTKTLPPQASETLSKAKALLVQESIRRNETSYEALWLPKSRKERKEKKNHTTVISKCYVWTNT